MVEINLRNLLLAMACALPPLTNSAAATPSPFSYQGYLEFGGVPADGLYRFEFSIHDSPSGSGAPLAGPLTLADTPVTNGVFSVLLDFGAEVFGGESRWLEVAVGQAGDPTNAVLRPRQVVTSVPYATRAGGIAEGGIPPGLYTNSVSFNNTDNQFIGTFRGTGTNWITGRIHIGETNGMEGTPNALVYILQPDFQGPAALMIEGAYTSPDRQTRYRTHFGAGNPAMISNGYVALVGSNDAPPFHNDFMLGIFTDVPACIEMVNQFWLTNAFLIEGAGPLHNELHPQVFTVNSRGQLSLVNPYGNLYLEPQFLLTDGTTANTPTYSLHSRSDRLTIGSYDTTARIETPIVTVADGNVGIGTTEPSATLDVKGTLYAPTNVAPFTVSTGTSTIITNSNNRSRIVLQVAFNMVLTGVPSCSVVSESPGSSETFVASPLPAGLGLTASVTNIYTLPMQPNAVLTITDTSSGPASIGLLDYTLFGE